MIRSKLTSPKNHLDLSIEMDLQSFIQMILEEDYDNEDEKQEWINNKLESLDKLLSHVESIFADFFDLPQILSDAMMNTIDFPELYTNLNQYVIDNP